MRCLLRVHKCTAKQAFEGDVGWDLYLLGKDVKEAVEPAYLVARGKAG